MISPMGGRRSPLILCFVLASVVLGCAGQDLSIANAQREITINSQLVSSQEAYKVHNDGTSAAASFLVCALTSLTSRRAFFQVLMDSKTAAIPLQVLPVGAVQGVPENVTCHSIEFIKPLAPGADAEVTLFSVYSRVQTPWPAAAAQDEPQRMVYRDTVYIVSPYKIAKQSTKVSLPNVAVEDYTRKDPVSLKANVVVYGPYSDILPFAVLPLRLHFENNAPFAVATSLVREIEVSHWGNIYVEEAYTVKHEGAKHKGQWSRLDYMQNPQKFGPAHFRELMAFLPGDANTLYFRDEIGNISTSHVRSTTERVEALLQPRFPLFGGWKVNFVFGYSLPLSGYATRLGNGQVQLVQMFSTPIKDLLVDDLTVKVVLPEGSSHIQFHFDFPLESSFDTKYSYLDTSGRPVLVLHKSNVISLHNKPITITYHFPALFMLREPLILILTFLALFLAGMVYTRCEFTISRDATWQAEQDEQKATAIVAKVLKAIASRIRAVKGLDVKVGEVEYNKNKAAVEELLKSSQSELTTLGKEFEKIGGKHVQEMISLLAAEKSLHSVALNLNTKRLELFTSGQRLVGSNLPEALVKQYASLRKEVTALSEALSESY